MAVGLFAVKTVRHEGGAVTPRPCTSELIARSIVRARPKVSSTERQHGASVVCHPRRVEWYPANEPRDTKEGAILSLTLCPLAHRKGLGVLFFAQSWVRVPGGPGAGGAPFAHPDYLQVPFGVLGSGDGLPQPRPGPRG